MLANRSSFEGINPLLEMTVDFEVILRGVDTRVVRVRIQLLLDLVNHAIEEDLSLDDDRVSFLPLF